MTQFETGFVLGNLTIFLIAIIMLLLELRK